MSKEQLGFLCDRQICDIIGVAQESIHYVMVKSFKSLILNIDLVKAYEKINWTFMRLVLLKFCLGLEVSDWIMGCLISTNFVVLINDMHLKVFSKVIGA